jgi:DNA invertase Pin-like site-specific DNA recombinase
LGIQSLLEAAHAEPTPFDYLLVDETVRLGRSLDVLTGVLGVLSRIGIAVHSLSVGVDSIEEELFACPEEALQFCRTETTTKPDSDLLI